MITVNYTDGEFCRLVEGRTKLLKYLSFDKTYSRASLGATDGSVKSSDTPELVYLDIDFVFVCNC